MHRLEHGDVAGIDVRRCSQSQPALKLCSQIAYDIAKHVAGDDDVELCGVLDHLHGQSIDVEMPGLDVGIATTRLGKGPLPQAVTVRQGIRLVAHAQPFQAVSPAVFEGVNEDPLHTLASVDVFLDGDFVGRIAFEVSAHADVGTFGILTENDKIDVLLAVVLQGTKPGIEQLHRPLVHVEVKPEAGTQEDVRRVLHIRHAGIAHRSDEDSVELPAEHVQRTLGQGNSLAQVFLCAPIEGFELDRQLTRLGQPSENLYGLSRNVDADAVTGNYGDAFHHHGSPFTRSRSVRYSPTRISAPPAVRPEVTFSPSIQTPKLMAMRGWR